MDERSNRFQKLQRCLSINYCLLDAFGSLGAQCFRLIYCCLTWANLDWRRLMNKDNTLTSSSNRISFLSLRLRKDIVGEGCRNRSRELKKSVAKSRQQSVTNSHSSSQAYPIHFLQRMNSLLVWVTSGHHICWKLKMLDTLVFRTRNIWHFRVRCGFLKYIYHQDRA